MNSRNRQHQRGSSVVETLLKRATVAIAVAALACVVLITPASAGHANTLCDHGEGGFSNNSKRYLGYYWINYSFWQASLDYIAIREDTAQNETFHQWQPGGTVSWTNTYNGLDHVLRTVIQRAGYTAASWGMDEFSHGFC